MYDRGDLIANFCDALGPVPLWLVPTRQGIRGDGLSWDIDLDS